MANTTPSSNFHQHFRQGIATLQEQIDTLSSSETPATTRQNAVDSIVVGIAKLSAELADASGELPSYDQRSYNQAIKTLNDRLAILRASHAPKSKFSFKNKRLAAPASEANSVTTSRSATPTHLQDPERIGRGRPTPAFAEPSTHVLSSFNSHHGEATEQSTTDDDQWILLSGKKDAYLRWPPSDIVEVDSPTSYGKTCIVSELSTSVVHIEASSKIPSPSALTINTVDGTLIIAPDVKGAAHITGLRDSVLLLSCHQFRMHKSHNVDVYLFCGNRPIIEDCSRIRFAPIPAAFDHSCLGGRLNTGQAVARQNMFDQVDDFKWLRAEASPNWRSLQEEEAITEQSWQEILERLRKLDGGADEASVPESIAKILRDLNIKTDSF